MILLIASDSCWSMNWLGENIRAVIVSHRLFTLDLTAASTTQRNQTCTHTGTYIVVFSPQMKHLHLNVTRECALLKQVVFKSHNTHRYATEELTSRGKTRRVVQNNTVHKLEPLRASPPSETSCTVAFAEQQTNHFSCTLFLCLHLSPSQDWSRLAPALASCPRRTVTCGDALGKVNVDRVKPNINNHNENNGFPLRKGSVLWLGYIQIVLDDVKKSTLCVPI